MANSRVDNDLTTGNNDGTTWANAYTSNAGHASTNANPVQSAMDDAGAGGQVWVQGATLDTEAVGRVLTSPGTIGDPVLIIGVIDGTTNDPIVESDKAVRGTDTLPVVQATGGSSDIVFVGYANVFGMKFDAADRIQSNVTWRFKGCEFKVVDILLSQADLGGFEFFDCELDVANAILRILFEQGSNFTWCGGEIIGTSLTNFLVSNNASHHEYMGVDLSNLAGNMASGGEGAHFRFANCKMPASWSLNDTQRVSRLGKATATGCSDATGIGANETYQDFIEESYEGTVELETTAIRTGGADDGATGTTGGSWGWKMTPNANSTRESILPLKSPWLTGWVPGDGSTAFTFTVYIANSLAADAANDLHEDEVSLELYTPSATADTPQYDIDHGDYENNVVPGSTTSVTDDTDSTWGTGANNHQKLQITVTPDHEGPFYCRVNFWQRGTTTLYVDPLVEVTS